MNNLQSKDYHLEVVRLLQLVDEVNRSIAISTQNNSSLEKKQYLFLKSQYVKDLMKLLKIYDLPIELKEAV